MYRSPFLQSSYEYLSRTRSERPAAIYTEWMKRYVLFHHFQTVSEMSGDVYEKVHAFLFALSASANTQNQALCALLVLYNEILEDPFERGWQRMKARRGYHLPDILSREDAFALFAEMRGTPLLMAQLLYGSGLKVGECAELRISQLDFEAKQISFERDHWTMIPNILCVPLKKRIDFVRGCYALKGLADESRFFVFPQQDLLDPDVDVDYYTHIPINTVQKAVRKAVRILHTQGTLLKSCSCQGLRDSFAVEVMRQGANIRYVQTFLGIKDIRQCLRYVRCLPITKQQCYYVDSSI